VLFLFWFCNLWLNTYANGFWQQVSLWNDEIFLVCLLWRHFNTSFLGLFAILPTKMRSVITDRVVWSVGPIAKPEGPLFSSEFVCLSVCLWPALLPFSVNRFWRNLVTRTLLRSSLAATIMFQIDRRGTARRVFENVKKNFKTHRLRISKFWSIIFCICVYCVL